MSIEKRLERIEAILDARGLDWDHPRVEEDHFAGANKMVGDEPAKEPEHPAGPKPNPGEGYRILSKDPLEDLTPGDEYELSKGKWVESANACTHKRQARRIWYRRKIEVAKEPPAKEEPPKDEYREPVLPGDCGKRCEFSSDGNDWTEAKLQGYAGCFWISVSSEVVGAKVWEHARIKKDA